MEPSRNTPVTTKVDGSDAAIRLLLDTGRRLNVEAHDSPLHDGKPFLILLDADGKERIEYLNDRFEKPHRKGGTVHLSDEASFVELWKRHMDADRSLIYGCANPAKFVAVFDDHGGASKAAGWRDHRADYVLGYSNEWKEWTIHNRKPWENTTKFAEWLEANAPDIVEPSGAMMVEVALNFRVRQNAAYSKAERLQDGNVEFSYTNTVQGESTTQAGTIRVPEKFKVNIPVFEGIGAAKYDMEAYLRHRLNGSQLAIWYDLIRPHKVVEQAFKDVRDRIEAEAKTKVLFGSPE
jgi:uncharacterized protein YfdQ (DUF2303 family)